MLLSTVVRGISQVGLEECEVTGTPRRGQSLPADHEHKNLLGIPFDGRATTSTIHPML